jgi:hypothetical protein
MRYETVQGLSDEDFRRSTGVQRSIFDTMLKTVKEILRDFGRPPKLSRADQLLLTLTQVVTYNFLKIHDSPRMVYFCWLARI